MTRGESYAFGNESTHGTVSMFEKEGFKTVAPQHQVQYQRVDVQNRLISNLSPDQIASFRMPMVGRMGNLTGLRMFGN